MYADDTHQELSRQALVRRALAINNTGRAHLEGRVIAERQALVLKRFEDTHGAANRVPLVKVVEFLTYPVGLGCIYVIDVLLFGASAYYIASLLGSESRLWARGAKYVVPLAFLGIEVLIALQIEKAREEERFAFGSSLIKRVWFALGFMVALVMPLAAAATAEAAATAAGSDTPTLMLAVLAIVSFAAHVLVLFGGRLAHEAKTYFAYAVARRFCEMRAHAAARQAAKTLASLNSMFIAYVHAWRAHNNRFAPQPSGPFDEDVVSLLRRQFPHVASSRDRGALEHEEEDNE